MTQDLNEASPALVSMRQSLVDRALIRETLSNILSHLQEDGHLYSTVLVSVLWAQVSLDHLWRQMKSVFPLLRILAPMAYDEVSGIWAFREGLIQPKWERFHDYARRIRILEHSDTGSEGGMIGKIHPNLLVHLLSCLPSGHGSLLPNIRELKWRSECDNESLPHVLPFLSPSLRTLHLETNPDFDSSGPWPRLQTVQGLAGRPDLSLTHLELIVNLDGIPDMPAAVGTLLDRQRCLQQVTLPSFEVTSPIANALQNLRQLRELDAAVDFSSLDQLGRFFSGLADGCPTLETLQLTVVRTPGHESLPLPFKFIAPLLTAKALSKLQLYFYPDHPISLQMPDIMAMGEAWPRMESLDISSTIPITHLPTYANAFPKLVSLRLGLTFPAKPVFTVSTPRFGSLEKLHLTCEPPEQELPGIAAFLSWVCPSTTTITHWDSDSSRAEQWNRIVESVKAGHQLLEAAMSLPGNVGTISV